MVRESVPFICTHNSARYQMAEGFLRTLRGDKYEAYSAGIEPTSVNPHAIQVMGELGIDISKHRSENAKEFLGTRFDYVVTVCDHAKESCPFFPGAGKYIHKNFEDPSAITGTTEETLAGFRRVRDQIGDWVLATFNGDV